MYLIVNVKAKTTEMTAEETLFALKSPDLKVYADRPVDSHVSKRYVNHHRIINSDHIAFPL
jgi:hypothetical protein